MVFGHERAVATIGEYCNYLLRDYRRSERYFYAVDLTKTCLSDS